jgi:primosomal replication protein N
VGEVTAPLAALALGSRADFAGFLAAARNGRGSVFNVTEVAAQADPV